MRSRGAHRSVYKGCWRTHVCPVRTLATYSAVQSADCAPEERKATWTLCHSSFGARIPAVRRHECGQVFGSAHAARIGPAHQRQELR